MKKPYFVMLRHPNGEYFLPLTDDNEENMQFATQREAHEGAKSSSLGSDVGYEIFDFREGL
jgi:hypothetical protein